MVSGMESGNVWGIQCEVPVTEYMKRLAIKDNIKSMIIALN
jgi:hypothetical protein